MKLTWYGHSAFRIEAGESVILIDPFLTGNPSWNGGWQEVAQGVTHVCLTHGHDDHVGDAVDVLKASGAMLTANFELCMYLAGKGVAEDRLNPGNPGGTVECGGFRTSFVRADHSSSAQIGDGGNVYLGSACGLVLDFGNGRPVYHMGDTDVFSDMALIAELHQPKVGIVPIGDRFTMGAKGAALACQRYFDFETIVPCHYGSFPIIDQTADDFLAAMQKDAGKVAIMPIGEAVAL